MGDKRTPSSFAWQFLQSPHWFTWRAIGEEGVLDRPYTRLFLAICVALFVGTVYVTYDRVGTLSPQPIVAALFINAPQVAWAVAALLHRGYAHLAANVAAIYIAAPIEDDLSRWQYLAVLIVTGYLPLFLDGLKLLLLGDEPHVAAYGASGFGFGLLGYGLVLYGSRELVTEREFLILALAVGAIASILVNLIRGQVDPISLKLGHLLGFTLGGTLAYLFE